MLDITSVPARSLSCPFSLSVVDTVVPYDMDGLLILFVGCENACVASLQDGKFGTQKFVSQYHRTLTAGACRTMGSDGTCVFALADNVSAITLHRVRKPSHDGQSSENFSSTVFVGDSWDKTHCIEHVMSVWAGGSDCGPTRSGADFVCTRHGETGIAWTVSLEREEARMLRVSDSLMRLYPQQQHSYHECFVGATSHGVSLISPANGETMLRFKLPNKLQSVAAVQASGCGTPWYAVVTSDGVALVYDQRRAEEPFCTRPLFAESKFGLGSYSEDGLRKNVDDAHFLMTSCGDGVFVILSAGQFHFLRWIDGSVSHRSFLPQESFGLLHSSTSGLCFTNGVLYVLGSK